MEKPKSNVIKSKSSNSAITTKIETKRVKINKTAGHNRKKSKSNAEFQTLVVRKRAAYVENNHASEAKAEEKQIVKPPPRPRPGSKRFLASVLTILSKSTTGTQYPDTTEAKEKKGKLKKKVADKITESTPDEGEKKKKPKFRSKILNDTKNQHDKFEVLQSKKNIVHTPSLYSEKSYKEDIKWSDLPRLVKPENDEVNETTMSNLVREVTEGRTLQKVKEKKVKMVDPDPTTLVSEHSEQKNDKRLYNFFVDLLETTFSVYNVKTEYNAAPMCSEVSSKIALEMDESVARKLNVGTEMYDDVTQKPSKHFHCIRSDGNCWNDDKLIDYFQSSMSTTRRNNELPLKSPGKRRLKAESFTYTRKRKMPAPQTQSVVITQRKSIYKKNKKEDLLNLLKEQLRMDHVSFEEPQNLYQALKVMAKHKRKQKTIRFDKSSKRPSDNFRPPECMLKGRKVISPNKKSGRKCEKDYMHSTRSIARKFSEISGYRRETDYSTVSEDMSNHSLEVYGFDYEISKKRVKKEREVYMPYHSSPSSSECEEDLLNFRDGSNSSIRDFESINS